MIVKCQNSTWQSLYDYVKEYNKSKITDNVSQLLEQLDQEIYGWGVVGGELTKHLRTKKDWIMFANLVNHAFKNWKKENPNLHESYFLTIENFCKKLDKIASTDLF